MEHKNVIQISLCISVVCFGDKWEQLDKQAYLWPP